MSWFKHKRRSSKAIQVPRVHFVAEQDGVPEQTLKAKLIGFFQRDKSVEAAYLARVDYSEQASISVALCLRTTFGVDKGMVEKVGLIFASVFGNQEHLDLIFLNEEQESELQKVCNPFFIEQ